MLAREGKRDSEDLADGAEEERGGDGHGHVPAEETDEVRSVILGEGEGVLDREEDALVRDRCDETGCKTKKRISARSARNDRKREAESH